MFVIKIENTTYALHPNGKTMFMTFRNRSHAKKTEEMLREFIVKYKTLPATYPDAGAPLALSRSEDWMHLLYELKIEETTNYEMVAMCEICNAGYLHVHDMLEPDPANDKMKLSYEGDVYEPREADIEFLKSYLETLV